MSTNGKAVATVFHFNARGLGYMLSTGGHCLELAQAAGAVTAVDGWYAKNAARQPALSPGITRMVLALVAQYQVGTLDSICLQSWDLRLKSMPASLHVDCLSLARIHASHSSLFSPTRARKRSHEIMKHTDTIPQDILSKLEMSLGSLEQSLLANDPVMPNHLRSVHTLLIGYPETVHLLEDAEIALLISSAKKHTATEITKETAAKPAGRSKKISADEL